MICIGHYNQHNRIR